MGDGKPLESFQHKDEKFDLHFNKISYPVENRGQQGKGEVGTLSIRLAIIWVREDGGFD